MFNGGMGNMQGMLKKVQKMQADMMKLQEDLKSRTVETTVGGGAVSVVVSGKKELKSIKIAPSAVDPDDVEMLEDLIISAVNEGMRKVDAQNTNPKNEVTFFMTLDLDKLDPADEESMTDDDPRLGINSFNICNVIFSKYNKWKPLFEVTAVFIS